MMILILQNLEYLLERIALLPFYIIIIKLSNFHIT
jgi:hypothetical protein